jgi:hypothetical protein
MAANGISTLATKELKQKAKLALAAIKRAATDRRAYLDITQLPTQYTSNAVTNNPNVGGLVVGRPWLAAPPYSAGMYRRTYGAYYNGTKTYFNTASVTGTAVATNFEVSTSTANFSYLYLGYILADYTGTWTFAFNTDDYCHIWVGPDAVPPPELAGAENAASPIGSGTFTVSMIAGTYYPVRVMWGNNGGPGLLSLSWNRNGSGASTDWSGKLFYNPATNGF